jgi:signal transduction histidine kinase
LALLFGLAEVMFTYSVLWDAQWWFWHFLRLTAYLLVLGYLVHDYRRMITDLTSSLAVTQRAEETSRRSEQHLRRALKEREQMAQDLHDGAIQSLFALRLALERCQRLVTKDPLETVRQLTKSIAALTTVIRDLRTHIVGGEPRLASGRELDQALVSLIKNVEGSQDLRVTLQVDPSTLERVTPDQATHLLYIAREALSNSLRHAQARSALVSLQRQAGGMRLMVEDDGCGFSPPMAAGQGVGLKNMAARAERLRSQLSIVSEPGCGTRIILDLPQEPVHAEK